MFEVGRCFSPFLSLYTARVLGASSFPLTSPCSMPLSLMAWFWALGGVLRHGVSPSSPRANSLGFIEAVLA